MCAGAAAGDAGGEICVLVRVLYTPVCYVPCSWPSIRAQEPHAYSVGMRLPVWAALLLDDLQLGMNVVQLQGAADKLHCL